MMGSVMGFATSRGKEDLVKENKMPVNHSLKQMPYLLWCLFFKLIYVKVWCILSDIE